MAEIPFKEFHRRVRTLGFFDLKELPDFALESPSMTGCFYLKDLPYLIAYCERHPQFHISTLGPELTRHNRILENETLYFLCRGDKDPSLFCRPDWEEMGEMWGLVFKVFNRTATPDELEKFRTLSQPDPQKNVN